LILRVEDIPGPTALLPYTATEEDVRRAAAICARYSDSPPGEPVPVRIRSSRGTQRIEVIPATDEEIAAARV
jgi:hypothetical protein